MAAKKDSATTAKDFRGKLGDDISASYAVVKATLEAAINAEKVYYPVCGACGKKGAHRFPDISAHLKAIELWTSMGFGKPTEPKVTRLELLEELREEARQAYSSLHQLSDDDLALFVIEPAGDLSMFSSDDVPGGTRTSVGPSIAGLSRLEKSHL